MTDKNDTRDAAINIRPDRLDGVLDIYLGEMSNIPTDDDVADLIWQLASRPDRDDPRVKQAIEKCNDYINGSGEFASAIPTVGGKMDKVNPQSPNGINLGDVIEVVRRRERSALDSHLSTSGEVLEAGRCYVAAVVRTQEYAWSWRGTLSGFHPSGIVVFMPKEHVDEFMQAGLHQCHWTGDQSGHRFNGIDTGYSMIRKEAYNLMPSENPPGLDEESWDYYGRIPIASEPPLVPDVDYVPRGNIFAGLPNFAENYAPVMEGGYASLGKSVYFDPFKFKDDPAFSKYSLRELYLGRLLDSGLTVPVVSGVTELSTYSSRPPAGRVINYFVEGKAVFMPSRVFKNEPPRPQRMVSAHEAANPGAT